MATWGTLKEKMSPVYGAFRVSWGYVTQITPNFNAEKGYKPQAICSAD